MGENVQPYSMISLFLLFFISYLTGSLARDTLTPSQPLLEGETLDSAGGTFALGFFTPAGSSIHNRYVGIWFNNIPVQTIVWIANRQTPVTNSTGVLSVSSNGTLIITTQNSTRIIWSSPVKSTLQNPIVKLLNSGNLVVRDSDDAGNGAVAWQSFDYPTDTLLPDMKLGWNLTSGLNRNLTAWSSATDPSPGPYSMALDLQGDPQLFLFSGTTKVWRVGPWDGVRFAGLPFMNANTKPFTFIFTNDASEVSYMFHSSVVARLIVTSTGIVQRLVWVSDSKQWNVFWQVPEGQCDQLSVCGTFGLCDSNDSPVCRCISGFKPKSPATWALRDGRDGCIRNTQLDCSNGTDKFYVVEGVKLPDTTNAIVDKSIGIDDCGAKCLSNCSCTGYAAADISNGGAGTGCVIWYSELTDISVYQSGGQDLFVRLAAADFAGINSGHSHSSTGSIIGIIIAVVFAALLASSLGCILWRRKKKRRGEILSTISISSHYNNENCQGNDIDLPLYDFMTIVEATDNFSAEGKLGEGGFGPVYKGVLAGGQEIAVKRLAKTSIQGLDEFKNEVLLIAKLQHRNLVRLLGCCIQADERMLVYEYMPSKSLDVVLFDKTKSSLLDWSTRYRIISGIARGLLYLHQDSRFRIIHRDMKASNILLDKEMSPKISDFGMARIFGGDEAEANTKKVVGTFGYMSPEYAMDGIFSVKSDVFSFGVLVLEIVSGKRNRGIYLSDPNLNLLGLAWNLWKEGRALDLLDESIGFSYSISEVMRCIKVGLLCVQERPEERPTMASVVLMLGSESIHLPSPQQPGYGAARARISWESSSREQESTVNDVTVTMFEGR